MTHTAGPWLAHDHNNMPEFGNDPKDWIGYAWVGFGGNTAGKFQSMVANLDRRKDGCHEFKLRAASDARLIAAAPELLEAAQYLLDDMRLNDVQTNCVEKLQRAIAKATGEPK
jgi:hypothetical protein